MACAGCLQEHLTMPGLSAQKSLLELKVCFLLLCAMSPVSSIPHCVGHIDRTPSSFRHIRQSIHPIPNSTVGASIYSMTTRHASAQPCSLDTASSRLSSVAHRLPLQEQTAYCSLFKGFRPPRPLGPALTRLIRKSIFRLIELTWFLVDHDAT